MVVTCEIPGKHVRGQVFADKYIPEYSNQGDASTAPRIGICSEKPWD
jgi:hypothetical protein